jgi:hypothetical protein
VKTVTPAMRTSMAAKWTMNEGGQRLAGLSFSQFLLNKTYPLSKGSSFSTWKRHLAHSGPQGGRGPCHFLCGACPSGQVCKAGGSSHGTIPDPVGTSSVYSEPGYGALSALGDLLSCGGRGGAQSAGVPLTSHLLKKGCVPHCFLLGSEKTKIQVL